MNNIRHKIGDKVLALSSCGKDTEKVVLQPRIKGKVYLVCDITYCEKCGRQSINTSPDIKFLGKMHCPPCNHTCNTRKGKLFTASTHYVNTEKLEQALELAISQERYEHAQVIVDYQKQLKHVK